MVLKFRKLVYRIFVVSARVDRSHDCTGNAPKQLKYIRDKVWYIDSAEYYIERKLHAEFWRSSNKYRQAVEIVSIPLEKMNSAITGIVGD